MTRRHFEAMADSLAALRPEGDSDIARAQYAQWIVMVRAMADVCASSNGRFDRGRFEHACQTRPNHYYAEWSVS